MTFTVHQWVDVFNRKEYVEILLENIRYCQRNNGLKIYSWVVMSNHCHLIVSSDNKKLSDIIRDLKKYTAKTIYKGIEENETESGKKWLIWLLQKDGEGYHGVEIEDQEMFESNSNYIHLNPVRAGIVEKEEEYLWSSCGEIYGLRRSLLELEAF